MKKGTTTYPPSSVGCCKQIVQIVQVDTSVERWLPAGLAKQVRSAGQSCFQNSHHNHTIPDDSSISFLTSLLTVDESVTACPLSVLGCFLTVDNDSSCC